MRFIQQVYTIPSYIKYFLNVVDHHSIQAPFAFQFYQELRQILKRSRTIEDIENERIRFMNEHTLVDGVDYGAGSRIVHSAKISSIAKFGISSPKDCLFIQAIANILKSNICIELGTSLGIATAYLAASIHVKLIYTFEGNKDLARMSHQLFNRLNSKEIRLVEGNIDVELEKQIEKIEYIDLAIIDANHVAKALLNYYELIHKKIISEGVIIVDDIRWSLEMYRGWKKLSRKPEVSLSMEFMKNGLLFFKKGIRKQHYVLSH